MSVAEAKRGYPVKLRGVVTYYNPYNTNLVVQDDSAGIYVRVGNSPMPPTLETGQLIDLDGFTGPGDVVPVITAPRIKVIGPAPMPAPMPIDPRAVLRRRRATASGWRWPASSTRIERRDARTYIGLRLHFKRIEIAHPRRAAAAAGPAARARQGAGRRRLALQLPPPDPRHHAAPAERGLPARSSRRRRRRRSTTIAELLQFTPSTRGDEPSAVQGVVLLTNPTGPTWLSDDTGGVLVATHARGDVRDRRRGLARPASPSPAPSTRCCARRR